MLPHAIIPPYLKKTWLIAGGCATLLLLFFAIVSPISAQNNQPSTITESTFWQLLSDMQTAAQHGGSVSDGVNTLSRLKTIESATGERWAIDTSALVEQLRQAPDPAPVLEQWLILHQSPTPSAQPEAAEALSNILAQAQFQNDLELSLWERIKRRFFNWLFANIDFSPRTLSIWKLIVGGVATALLVWFLRYWLRSMRRQFSAETHLPLQNADDYALSASDALQQAHTNAANDNLREAVRYLYLSTLLNLDERDMLRFDRSKTNREYVRQIADSTFANTLSNVVDIFDRVWYGFQPIDQTTYRHYAAQVEELLR